MTTEFPSREGQPLWKRFMGRTFDIVVSLAFLLTLFPIIYVIVAIVIKHRSPGPAIVLRPRRQARGKDFEAYHFRLSNEDSFLARMPQMMNVLRGEMRFWIDVRLVDNNPLLDEAEEGADRPVTNPRVDDAPSTLAFGSIQASMETRSMEGDFDPVEQDDSQPMKKDEENPAETNDSALATEDDNEFINKE